MKIAGKFKLTNPTIRSVVNENEIIADFKVVSYYDFSNKRIGYCNSEFDFIFGVCFEI